MVQDGQVDSALFSAKAGPYRLLYTRHCTKGPPSRLRPGNSDFLETYMVTSNLPNRSLAGCGEVEGLRLQNRGFPRHAGL